MTQTPTRALLALLLAAGTGLAAPAPALAADAQPAAAAASAPVLEVRKETQPLFRSAQDLQAAQNWVGVLAKLKEIEAIGNLNASETYLVARSRAVAAYSVKDYPTAAAAFRQAIDAPFLAAADKPVFLEFLFQVQFNDLKDYPKALATLQEYLKAGGSKPGIADLEPSVRYAMGDFPGAIQGFAKQVADEEKAGRQPTERMLRLLISAQISANDDDGIGATAEKLAAAYPKRDVWSETVQRAAGMPGMDKQRLEIDRLRQTVLGYGPKDGPQIVGHAYRATRGYPAEAKKLMDEAFARNLVPAGEAAEAAKTRDAILRSYNKEKADDKVTETSARAAKDGEALCGYGLELFLDGQVDRGIDMMQAGVAKGGLKNPVEHKLHLGMALLRAGRLDDARKVLEPIAGKDGLANVARVYLLWIKVGAKLPD